LRERLKGIYIPYADAIEWVRGLDDSDDNNKRKAAKADRRVEAFERALEAPDLAGMEDNAWKFYQAAIAADQYIYKRGKEDTITSTSRRMRVLRGKPGPITSRLIEYLSEGAGVSVN